MTFQSIQWTSMNGEFVPWAESTVPLSTHALHYGTRMFEGIRSYAVEGKPAIFRLGLTWSASTIRQRRMVCAFLIGWRNWRKRSAECSGATC